MNMYLLYRGDKISGSRVDYLELTTNVQFSNSPAIILYGNKEKMLKYKIMRTEYKNPRGVFNQFPFKFYHKFLYYMFKE